MPAVEVSRRSFRRGIRMIALVGLVVGTAVAPAVAPVAAQATKTAVPYTHPTVPAAPGVWNPYHWTFVRAYPDTSAGRKAAEAAGKAAVASGRAINYLLWSAIPYANRWNLWFEVYGKA
jgi:hypothetical protein